MTAWQGTPELNFTGSFLKYSIPKSCIVLTKLNVFSQFENGAAF